MFHLVSQRPDADQSLHQMPQGHPMAAPQLQQLPQGAQMGPQGLFSVPMAANDSAADSFGPSSWFGDFRDERTVVDATPVGPTERNGSIASSGQTNISNEEDLLELPALFDGGVGPDSESSEITSPEVGPKQNAANNNNNQNHSIPVVGQSVLPPGANAGLDFMTAFIKEEALNSLSDPAVDPMSRHASVSSTSSASGRIKKPLNTHQRKAHNKIERKYRININSKIAKLQKLVPWVCNQSVAFEVEGGAGQGAPDARKLNKSMILDLVTKYIVELKKENMRLQEKIAQYEPNVAHSNADAYKGETV